MPALGAVTPGSSGSITSPTSLDASVGSALSTTVTPYGVYDSCPIAAAPADVEVIRNAVRGVLFSHGVEAMFHTVEGARYRTGLRAPKGVQTLASTGGAKATATLTFTAQPNDGETIVVGHPSRPRFITFKTTLVTNGTARGSQVLRGANLAAAIANLEKLVNATGIHGVDYFNDQQHRNATISAFKFTDPGNADVSITSTTGTTAVFTAGSPGTFGNSYRAMITTGASAQIASFGTSDLFTSGASGTGTEPGLGSRRYAYAHYRSGDGAQSAIGTTVQLVKSNNGNVNQTSFTAAPTRDGTTHIRWFRTQNGAVRYYRGADVVVGTSEPFVDAVSDDTLIGAFALLYDETLFRPYAAGYPQVVRYVTNFKDRVFGAGASLAADYTQGTADVTLGADAVILATPAKPKQDWIGRTFRVANTTQEYTILDVTESSRTLVLHGAYTGATNATASYTVYDKRDPFEVFWSEPGLPNNWPISNSVKGITSKDARGVTGIKAAWDGVLAWTWTGLWKVEGAGGVGFRILPISEGMGAFSNLCVQTVRGVVYWLGPDGIFAWGGSGDPECLSSPAASQARGIQGTIERINLAAADQAVSVYNPSKQRISWFVPVDGEERNRLAIVYDLQTGAFATDTCEEVTAATCVPDPSSGLYHTVTGDSVGALWQHDLSTSDGAFGFETVATVTSYATATKTVTASGASFTTTGDALKGVPVVKIDTLGAIEYGKIASNTGTTLVLCSPFTTAPAAGDFVIPGAIVLDIQTGRFDFQQPEVFKKFVWVTAAFQPSTAGRLWVAVGIDNSDPTVNGSAYADLTATDGEYMAWFRRGKFRRAAIRFVDAVPGHTLHLIGFVPKIAAT